jgi:hypothetical protein
MAYTMVAERNNQKVRKQRESALIVLASAQAMQVEGWDVVILDENGSDFDPRAFEAALAGKFSWYEVKPEPVPFVASPEPAVPELEEEAVIAAALDAEEMEIEELESTSLDLRDIDESDFEELDFAGSNPEEVELDDAEQAELDEAELEELEFEGEPAE